MSADHVAAIGAFLSGVGSVLGAMMALRILRKRMRQDCEERIQLLKEGIKIGRQQ